MNYNYKSLLSLQAMELLDSLKTPYRMGDLVLKDKFIKPECVKVVDSKNLWFSRVYKYFDSVESSSTE